MRCKLLPALPEMELAWNQQAIVTADIPAATIAPFQYCHCTGWILQRGDSDPSKKARLYVSVLRLRQRKIKKRKGYHVTWKKLKSRYPLMDGIFG
jgi:hypothetical protein